MRIHWAHSTIELGWAAATTAGSCDVKEDLIWSYNSRILRCERNKVRELGIILGRMLLDHADSIFDGILRRFGAVTAMTALLDSDWL